ncbi:MAG: 50S ribosomal protein L23 [Candidatus Paceibacterota bacterium]
MALFWSKKSKAEKIYDKAATPVSKKAVAKTAKVVESGKAGKGAKAVKAIVAAGTPAAPSGSFGSESEAVLRPHITEKSGLLSAKGVYTFQVSKGASKQSVAKAIKALYKITPVKIAMINLPARTIVVKGRRGTVSGVRKALVTVKSGDKIDFA